jgi:thiamine biosynthesis lipoprotein
MSQPLHRIRFVSMGCPCELAFHATPGLAPRLSRAVLQELQRLDWKYSRFRSEGALHRLLHRAARPGGIAVDAETSLLLDYASLMHRESGGLFDITAGALTTLWDRFDTVPSQTALSSALARTGWSQVSWNGTRLQIPAGMTLEFGGLVKEYAADRCAAILRRAGIEAGYVDLGGDIHFLGPHPDGDPWHTGIRDPAGGKKPAATIAMRRGALASSGDYERCTEIDGVRYSHFIDPVSGWPVNLDGGGLSAVSVIAHSCLLAGSLSTLACLADAYSGLRLLEESGLPWLAFTRDGGTHGTIEPPPSEIKAA